MKSTVSYIPSGTSRARSMYHYMFRKDLKSCRTRRRLRWGQWYTQRECDGERERKRAGERKGESRNESNSKISFWKVIVYQRMIEREPGERQRMSQPYGGVCSCIFVTILCKRTSKTIWKKKERNERKRYSSAIAFKYTFCLRRLLTRGKNKT